MKVKICGLRYADEVRAAVDLGFDYLGFILEPKRQRTLSLKKASLLAELALNYSQNRVQTVAVAISVQKEWLPLAKSDPLAAFSLLQFYKSENWSWSESRRFKIVHNINDCYGASCYIFDQSQGSGQWQEPPTWLKKRQVFFAGGVVIEKIAQLQAKGIYGVDISSGLESNGRKNYVLMQRCMRAIHHEMSIGF